MIIIVYRS